MGKAIKNPRYNVISIRISEEERRYLNTLIERNRKSISAIMREAMQFFLTSSSHNAAH